MPRGAFWLIASLMKRITILLSSLVILAASCKNAPETKPVLSEPGLFQYIQVARTIDAGDEGFDSFKKNVRASFKARSGVQERFLTLDDDLELALLAVYARQRSTNAAPELLAKMINHRTVNEKDVEIPGRGPAFDALENDVLAFSKANELYFDTVDHVAHAVSLKGAKEAKERVAILVHLDVVPAKEPGWSSDPFKGEVTEDRVKGRGALDDKGPLVAALFALNSMRESGIEFAKDPTLIMGSSEETHWTGIEQYLKERGVPEAVFVADGGFPVGIGEKGVSTARLKSVRRQVRASPDRIRLFSLKGGQVSNQVPARAEAVLGVPNKAVAFFQQHALEHKLVLEVEAGHTDSQKVLRIKSEGKAAHGSTPQEGVNAILPLVRFLVVHGSLLEDGAEEFLNIIDEVLDESYEGARVGLFDTHPRFTNATANLGTIEINDKECVAAINLRWPPPLSAKEVVARVQKVFAKASKERLALEVSGGGLDPFLVDENGALVRSLLKTYSLFKNTQGESVTLSGTTYAKAVPGSVTFGPSDKSVSGDRIHGANEYITKSELADLVELYTYALARLAKKP